MRKFLIVSSATLLMSGAAQAADLGQYRPGNPYQSVIAPGAGVCESHCAGDAQCRSWNYVKANPNGTGVCEFNANDVPPVASAISISGSNQSPAYRQGVIPGGTNTIRVGTQPQSRPQSPQQVTSSSPNRRIVREPVSSQSPTQPASTDRQRVISGGASGIVRAQPESMRAGGSSSPQQARVAAMPQTFKYDLGDRAAPQPAPMQNSQMSNPQAPRPYNLGGQAYPAQNPMPQAGRSAYAQPHPPQQAGEGQSDMAERTGRRRQQGPSMQKPGSPQLVYRSAPHAGLPGQMPAQNQAASQGQPYPPQSGFAPNAAPQTSRQQPDVRQQAMVRRSANDPVTYGSTQNGPVRSNSNGAPSQARNLAQGLSAEQAQQSLFGKLNDDVQVPNSGATVPVDPNAPIPTMSSRVSGTVEQSALAGGPN